MTNQQKEVKYLADIQTSRLNADDGQDFVQINEWCNLENFRSASTDKGITGVLESIGSNLLLSTVLPSQTFITIGGAIEVERNRFCFFKFCTTGPWHKITCRDNTPGIEQEFDVIYSSQVTGGLNFDKNSIIHSATIINGNLIWPDSTTNQPRMVNIDAAIKGNHSSYSTDAVPYEYPINFSEITLIKPPPPLAPNISKDTDATFENNFIANDSFMFAYRYKFYGSNYSVIGTYSPSSRLNKLNATENYIVVTMDLNEAIPQRARIVELIMRFSNSNNAYIVKTWDKEITTENQEIEDQNNGTQLLTFNFYNNIRGEAIPNGLDENGRSIPGLVNLVLKPFDSVPIYSEGLAAAKNKIFLANNTEGYDTPLTTSMSFSLIETDTTTANLRKPLIQVLLSWDGVIDHGYSSYYVFLTEVVPQGYYEITSTAQYNNSILPPDILPAPGFIAFGSLNWRGATQSEVIQYVKTTAGAIGTQAFNFFITLTDPIAGYINITGLSISSYDFFKTRTQYQVGIVFYDFAMRKCGVVTTDGLTFEIPTRDYDFTSGVSGVVWVLTNDNALNQIPDWAYYYAVVRTLNLRTRFFIQSFTNTAKYATKDIDGNYVFSNDLFVTNTKGIGLDTGALVQSGLGYVFNQGDVCVLVRDDDQVYELPVIGQDGNYIIIAAKDIGSLNNRRFVYEIYTPYQVSTQEPYYEVGEMYRIINPGTSARLFGTLSDIFLPDSYVLTRNYSSMDYMAEAMSPNDLFWQRWDNDGGKVNFVTKLGQSVKTNSISYSNNFIPNTDINGINTFDAFDEGNMPQEGGPIRKIILTSKVQNELGSVMLILCENQVISIYVGEVQQYGSTGRAANIVTSEQVIGTINILKGNYGTIDPESVVEFRGKVWFFDAINGRWVQYSENGLFPISNYKMTRFWGQWAKQYLSMTKSEIESFGDRPFIFATVDPYHGELLISIPKLMNIPPKGYLPDYSIQSPMTVTAYNIRQTYTLGDITSYYYGLCVYITNVLPAGYYLVPFTESYTSSPVPDSSPETSYNFSELFFRGGTSDNVLFNTRPEGATLVESSVSSLTTVTINNVPERKIYPFDILDFQGKTIVYQLDKGTGIPKWMGSYSFVTEYFITLFNQLYSFKQGLLYLHNQTTSYNQFYGVSYKSKVMPVFNQGAPIPKVFNSIALKTNLIPTLVYGYTDNPNQQCTDLVDFDFTNYEGVLYATFYRNKLTPTAIGYDTDALLTGEKMRGAAMFVLIEFTVSSVPEQLEYISINSTPSIGQTF